MTAAAGGLPRVLEALAETVAAHPLERKLLVCRRAGTGREILRALSAAGVPWANFEVATPLSLAHRAVATRLAAEGLRMADGFDELTLLDQVTDRVLASATGRFRELAGSVGLRQAMARSVQALRVAGVTAAELAGARLRDEEKRDRLHAILAGYEEGLAAAGLVDGAGVLGLAAAGDAVASPGDLVLLLPGLPARGLTGRLLAALLAGGARVLPAEPVYGLGVPPGWVGGDGAAGAAAATALSWLHQVGSWQGNAAGGDQGGAGAPLRLDVFAASSVQAELREVLRRVMAAGLQWDEVEIVATDPMVYGVALDGLARRLDIPVSYAAGLPLARTRPGRAVQAFLEWVRQDYPAEQLRRMLERGDVAVPELSGAALARRLRRLRVTGGRERYLPLVRRRLEQLAAPPSAPRGDGDDRSAGERAADADVERRELEGLAGLLERLLAAAPVSHGEASPAELAAGLTAVLRMTPDADGADRTARARLLERLARIQTTPGQPLTLAAAASLVLSRLEDRVPSPATEGRSPWTAAGGYLHLSDLEHGGWAARKATFVVGLDAARFPGSPTGDALLVDEDRRRLAGDGAVPRLPLAADRLAERRYAFAALAARLRGSVTFSYATWDAVEGRSVAPSSELLQAYRLLSGEVTADYEALHRSVAPAVSPVPRGSALLDAADAWLHLLAAPDPSAPERRTLRRAVAAVCQAYPGLHAGARAWKLRLRRDMAGPHHGILTTRPELDPRLGAGGGAVSATALQTLGSCPRRYLLRYVLKVRPPDDPEAAPDQWLGPLERGTLLHELFEGTLREAASCDVAYDHPAFPALAMELLEQRALAMRELLPPPGEAVYAGEMEALREDVRAFVAMVREDAPRVLALELAFGRGGPDPVELLLPGGETLRVAGAIDRVDDAGEAGVVIVDYKTGSDSRFGRRSGPYDGGRRLQHVVYAAVAEQILNRPVARAEFHFPTGRSQNRRVRYDAATLRAGLPLLDRLLDLVREGWFVPTSDDDDCRFCDYAATCRVRTDDRGRVTSPLAQWGREADHEAADLLRRIRR
jgi:hypothetical protein